MGDIPEEDHRKLHVDLLTKLVCDYLSTKSFGGDYLMKFRMNLKIHFTTPVQKSLVEPRQMIDEMERLGLLRPGKYYHLKEAVKNIDPDILRLIEDTERKMGILGTGPITQATN